MSSSLEVDEVPDTDCNSMPDGLLVSHEESSDEEPSMYSSDEYPLQECPSNDLMQLPHPAVGMEFDTYESLIHYYDEYSLVVGFQWKVHGLETKRKDGEKPDFVRLWCSKSGTYKSRAQNPDATKQSIKTNCQCKINAHQNMGSKWKITTVENVHNHEVDPTNCRFMANYRRISPEDERSLRLNALAGIPMCKSYAVMALKNGGYSKVPFTERDGRNCLNKIRRLALEDGDYAALVRYMDRMASETPNFYGSSDIADDGRVRNVFWADGRSREAYKDFGDVLSFDATYMKNRYRMPFCPFIGVNQHGQSILLGCALISGESTRNYVWVFNEWLKCMGGQAPKGIVTDQSRAITNAIERVFPHTVHRLCLFHIMQNARKYLKHNDQWHAIQRRIKNVLHYTLTVSQFIARWGEMLDEFQLWDNPWLQRIFVLREKWAPIYFKGQFWAGISSTQRSEGMNNFFKSFFNLNTTLKEFAEQFNMALAKRVEAEATETFRINDAPIQCRSEFVHESIFGRLYTRKKFLAFQKELLGVPYLLDVRKKNGDDVHNYVVQDISRRCLWYNSEGMFFRVRYKPTTKEIWCQCRLFEFSGILCRHIVQIFLREGVRDVPGRYILDRWRKDIPRNYLKLSIHLSCPNTLGPEPVAYSRLRSQFEEVARVVVSNPALTAEMEAYMTNLNIRGLAMAQQIEGLEVVHAGEGVGRLYRRRRRNICANPMPVDPNVGADIQIEGGECNMEPGQDPLSCRGPGRMRKNRLGYYAETSNRGREGPSN